MSSSCNSKMVEGMLANPWLSKNLKKGKQIDFHFFLIYGTDLQNKMVSTTF